MSNIDKHAVQAVADLKAGYTLGHADVAILNELARIALASLEAEAVISHVGGKNALDAIVAFIKSNRNPTLKDYNEVSERLFQDNCHGLSNHVIEYIKQIGEELEELRSTQDTAPPAPASVPDVVSWEDVPEEITEDDIALASAWAHGFNQCRAAILQGAEPVSQPYTLPDGYCIMPMKLTAENGAKCALAGEFSETKFISCPECFGDDECETCDGTGRIEISVPVSWTTIKDIWAKGVEHFAEAAPQQEVK
ncbi:hypothetical protein ACFVF4_002129 [Enterobacter hormaechei]